MFAVKLLNMDKLTQILYDVSDPASANYGKHKTAQEIKELTSNPTANAKIHEYLKSAGVDVASESLGGEYITARAPVKLWENMFSTEFFIFHHTLHGESKTRAYVRAEKYSIPLALNDYVSIYLYIHIQCEIYKHISAFLYVHIYSYII
jgi:tripeptidyl-peptidase-1